METKAAPLEIHAARTLSRSKVLAIAVALSLFLVPMTLTAAINPALPLIHVLRDGFVMGMLLGAVGFLVAYLARSPKEAVGTLRMNGDVLEQDGEPIANRRELGEGHAWEASDGAHVQLRRGRRSIQLRMRRLEDARALLGALGVDASKKAARFRILSPSRTHRRVRFGAILLSLPLSIALAVLVQKMTGVPTPGHIFMLPYLFAVACAYIPGRVRVGVDGVLVSWLWQQRFVPTSEIESVELVEKEFFNRVWISVRLGLRGHGAASTNIEMLVASPSRRFATSLEGGRASARTIVERIEEARAVARNAGGEDAARVLGREGRSAADWLLALRQAFGHVEGFRGGPPLTTEQLWAAVEDQDARAWVRAAAAAALAGAQGMTGEEERSRLRVAAEATAAPKLRVALEAAASADDARLAEALGELDDERPEEAPRAQS